MCEESYYVQILKLNC